MTAAMATFAFASDLHLGLSADTAFAQAQQRVDRLLADLRQQAAGPGLDWLVVAGDLSAKGAVEPSELAACRAALDGLGLPYNVVAGNHDLCPSPAQEARFPGTERYEPVPLAATAYGRAFGPLGLDWHTVLGGVEFLGLTLRAGDPDGALERLARQLQEAAPAGVRARVLVSHYPTRPVRDGGPLAHWGPGHLGATAEALETLIAGAVGPVPLVAHLLGHVHVLAAGQRAGVWHLTPGAVGAGCPGFRLCHIFADRLEARFLPLSDPALAVCGFWSRTRPEACQDSTHRDFAGYHAGTAAERAVTIPLPPPKGP